MISVGLTCFVTRVTNKAAYQLSSLLQCYCEVKLKHPGRVGGGGGGGSVIQICSSYFFCCITKISFSLLRTAY
jgi:hypothetical protein